MKCYRDYHYHSNEVQIWKLQSNPPCRKDVDLDDVFLISRRETTERIVTSYKQCQTHVLNFTVKYADFLDNICTFYVKVTNPIKLIKYNDENKYDSDENQLRYFDENIQRH